jgi:hypothetical protein
VEFAHFAAPHHQSGGDQHTPTCRKAPDKQNAGKRELNLGKQEIQNEAGDYACYARDGQVAYDWRRIYSVIHSLGVRSSH